MYAPWVAQRMSKQYSSFLQMFFNTFATVIAMQLEKFQPWIIFQKDGAPTHQGSLVCNFLGKTFPDLWIERDGPNNLSFKHSR